MRDKAHTHTHTHTGTVPFTLNSLPGTPRLSEDAEAEELQEVKRVAGIFKMDELVTICENIEREEEFLNPSIGTFLNDEAGTKMKDMFLNKETDCDVVFVLDGKV